MTDSSRCDADAVRLGHALQEARKRAGLTQRQLADLVGYSQRAISDIETGNTNVHAVVLYRLAKAMAVDPVELCLFAWPSDDQMLQADDTERELLLLVKQIPPERRDLARRLLSALR